MLLPILFRRLLCLFATISFLPTAIAGDVAGLFEKIGPVYQTYRIAIATWGVNQDKMLTDLPAGTHPDGGANFVEVLNYLHDVDIDETEFFEEVGSVKDPDPYKAVDHMLSEVHDDDLGRLKLEKIFAGIPDSFPAFLGQIRTVLEQAHERMKTNGNLDDIKPFRDRLKVCHEAIITIRQSDMVAGTNGRRSMVKDIKNKWPGALFQVNTKIFPNLESQQLRIFTVDMAETIARSPQGLFTRAEVSEWVNSYGQKEDDTRAAKEHYEVITQHQATQTMVRLYFLSAALLVALGFPSIVPSISALNWKTFKGNGWSQYSGGALDEWGLCAHLGTQCGPVLKQRYATYVTPSTINKLAAAGVNILRIPTTYAAWVKVPGSQLYSGNQKQFLKNIATYAINNYKMYIIVDIHCLPGGVNGMGFGEAEGHFGWFNNQAALAYSYEAIDAVVEFVQSSGFPQSFTIEPINEPVDNPDMAYFGTPETLSEAGAAWTLQYITGVIQRITATNPDIPLMFQGSFRGESYQSPQFSESTNLVFDVHNYYFAGRPTDSDTVSVDICSDAKASAGDGKFPVWIGEWSIQIASDNKFANRRKNLNTGLYAFNKYTQGSAYWTAKFCGNVPVEGEGVQGDYWNYESFIDLGYINPSEGAAYCT